VFVLSFFRLAKCNLNPYSQEPKRHIIGDYFAVLSVAGFVFFLQQITAFYIILAIIFMPLFIGITVRLILKHEQNVKLNPKKEREIFVENEPKRASNAYNPNADYKLPVILKREPTVVNVVRDENFYFPNFNEMSDEQVKNMLGNFNNQPKRLPKLKIKPVALEPKEKLKESLNFKTMSTEDIMDYIQKHPEQVSIRPSLKTD
jgi:hypothetical protein